MLHKDELHNLYSSPLLLVLLNQAEDGWNLQYARRDMELTLNLIE
jgi:hypothetical protein